LTTILLLTPGMPPEESKGIASMISNRVEGTPTLLSFDPASESGRRQARQALATGRVDLAISSEARFDCHVLPEATVPVVVVARSPGQLWRAADVVGYVRARGVNVSLAPSWDDAIARIQAILSPPILSGKRVLIFAEPFTSATIPSRNLTHEYVLERTGVDVMFRPLTELKESLSDVLKARATAERDSWIEGAAELIGPSLDDILDSCRLYILLKDIVAEEDISGVSIDCVRYSFSEDPLLPHPCLAFSRLRDQGIAAPCEADVCAMLTELLLEGIAQKPSFLGNIGTVDVDRSTIDLLHCVAPLKMAGFETDPVIYRLRDYHGLGRGVALDIDFPTGREVTIGSFSKDLRSFVLWPGTLVETGSGYCRSMARIKIQEPLRFLQSISGCHYLMVYGNHIPQISSILTTMNISIIGPVIGCGC